MKEIEKKKYIIVYDQNAIAMEGQVNNRLDNGYTLFGNPYSDTRGYHYQAMVRITGKNNNLAGQLLWEE